MAIHPRAAVVTGLTLLGIGSVSILGGAAVLASALTSNNGLTMLVGIIVGPILVLSGTIADVISLPFLLSSTHYWLDDDGAWRIAT